MRIRTGTIKVHHGTCSVLLFCLVFMAGIADTDGRRLLSDAEGRFLEVPNATRCRRSLRYITSVPHVAGTFEDWTMARYVRDQFKAYGIPKVSVDGLDVYLNYPVARPVVQLLNRHTKTINNDGQERSEVLFDAKLSEDVLDFDKTSNTVWRDHIFHGYSPSGEVPAAPLAYAHYGRPEDFDALEAVGMSVKGKVVLVRYGRCFRGLKVMNAERRGALAVLIYSDPVDDGYVQGKVYPAGPWRPSFGVQRGSVQFISLCAGDPYRIDSRYSIPSSSVQELCGYNATDLIPSIPSLPLSYGDAEPLLQDLAGLPASQVFGENYDRGGLNLTYRIGPSIHPVRVRVSNQGVVTSVPNVVGVIPGRLPPDRDQPVLLGNHRDAWVYGAADPNSGTASLLEVARGLGMLLKTGTWRPARTVFLLSWSGEEYGLLGSTGWAEINYGTLLTRAVAYLNVDTVVSGDILGVSLTPSLSRLWERVLDDLRVAGHTLPFGGAPHGRVVDANTNRMLGHPYEKILGSGSDYAVFLDRFGIPSLDFAFGKRAHYGQYHSVYDSFSWMDAYGGSEGETGSAFSYMALAAKIWGLMALRLADSNILPIDVVAQGSALVRYVDAIREQSASVTLEFDSLVGAIGHFGRAAAELRTRCFAENTSVSLSDGSSDTSSCNDKLGLVERYFLTEMGLPRRKWFRHILQAPGMFLVYSAEAFPGVQQAIDDGDLLQAQEQINVAAERIESAARFLEDDRGGIETS